MAVSSSTTSAPALSFPREIFAALQPRQYLLAHLAPPAKSQTPIRPNGRAPTEFRKPSVNINSLTHCNGSAVVRLGDTAVVCGVRGEILLANDIPNPPNAGAEDEDDAEEISSLNLLVPNVELSTGSNPSHIPGQAPSGLAQSLASRLLQLLSSTQLVSAQDLRIWHQPPTEEETGEEAEPVIKAYWTLYLDVLYISLDGAAFDAAWMAIVAALQATLLPKARWDQDMEAILCSDSVKEAKSLSLRGFPIPASFAIFDETTELANSAQDERAWLLADPDKFEEDHCHESICMVVDLSGNNTNIRAIDKHGGGSIDLDKMKTIVELAGRRWKESRAVLISSEG